MSVSGNSQAVLTLLVFGLVFTANGLLNMKISWERGDPLTGAIVLTSVGAAALIAGLIVMAAGAI